MFDSVTLSPVLALQDAFSIETTRAIRTAYDSVYSTPTRLMSLRSLVAKLARGYVTKFELRSDHERTSQHFTLLMGNYSVRVRLGAFASGYSSYRCIEARDRHTVLDLNSVLKNLHADWMRHKSLAQQDHYSVMQDLVMRAFLLCSADAIYQCSTEPGRWTVFFHDVRARAQAEIVVERLG